MNLITFNLEKINRFRIAPSPTGELHLGNLYIFLWNLVLAHKKNGKVILRIDDTDLDRNSNKNFEKETIDLLSKFGFEFEFAIKQSSRISLYQQIAEELVKYKKAYYCMCSKERLQNLKKDKNYIYDRFCINKNYTSGILRLINNEEVKGEDVVRGNVIGYYTGDIILMRENGIPTYHFASCVDDFLFDILYIVRSVEWLPFMNTHTVLFNYLNDVFGNEKKYMPLFLHLPLLKEKTGLKLSKRREDASINYWLREGYLPKAIVNYLLSLSWKYKNEIFNIDEIDNFNLRTSNPCFDVQKLDWYNRKYIQSKDTDLNYLITKEIKDKLYFFNFNTYLNLQQKNLKNTKEIYELIDNLIKTDLEIIKILIKDDLLKIDYIETTIKLFSKKMFLYDLDNYEKAKEKYNLSPEIIHFIRDSIIGLKSGLNIIILIKSINFTWFIQRLKFIKKQCLLIDKIKKKNDK